MKALSIYPEFAMAIATGEKSIEVRTWSTDYRGPILICSTAKKVFGTIPSHALAVVDLVDVQPFRRDHLEDAMLGPSDYQRGMYAWILDNNRLIKPIPVKGRLSLWNFADDDKIIYIPEAEWVDSPEYGDNTDWYSKYWESLVIGGK